MRFLSVDDSATTRHFIRNAVELMGEELLEAKDGVEGLEFLEREKRIDLVLLDVNMPRMDGMEMLRRLKEDHRLKHIPVLMVTTEFERVKVINSIAAGAKNYLIKPFTQEELIGKIMEALGLGI